MKKLEILASCSYEESQNYSGKIVSETDGKPDRVYLNIVVSDGDTSVLGKLNTSVKCVTFINGVDLPSDIELPDGKVFVEYALDTVSDAVNVADSAIPLLRVDDDYSDMKSLKELCQGNPRLRVIGGNLLNIDGVRIGRYDVGKDKGSPVYNGVYDTFVEVPLSGIENVKSIVKKSKRVMSDEDSSSSSKKSSKAKKTSPRKSDLSKSFSSLFSGITDEDF